MKFIDKVIDLFLELPEYVRGGAVGFVFGVIFGLIL